MSINCSFYSKFWNQDFINYFSGKAGNTNNPEND